MENRVRFHVPGNGSTLYLYNKNSDLKRESRQDGILVLVRQVFGDPEVLGLFALRVQVEGVESPFPGLFVSLLRQEGVVLLKSKGRLQRNKG